MKRSSPLSDYYKNSDFNPTFIDFSSDNKIQTQFKKRANLYCNKLKLPLAVFNNASCLEFGCSSGENSLFLASLGAAFTFVEPQIKATKRLKKLFDDNNLEKKILRIHNDIIENFETSEEYDFVIAEGFLNYVPTRNKELIKILKVLNSTGIGIISTADPYGQFIQLLKVFIFKYFEKNNNYSSDEEKLELGKRLFSKEYALIPHSRPFEMYVRDTFLNPYFASFKYWGLEEMLPFVHKAGFGLYSSWPYYGYNNDLTWHKHIPEKEEYKEEVVKRYQLNAPNFIASEELNINDLSLAKEILTRLSKVMRQVENIINNSFTSKLIDNEDIAQLIKLIQIHFNETQTEKVFTELERLMSVLYDQDEGTFIQEYNNSLFVSTWGIPYHYISFSRT